MAELRSGSLLVALLAGLWSSAAAAALEPHVAAYRLSLAGGADMANPFSEVRGGLVVEWRLACDGWLSRQRLAFVGTLQEGGDLAHDVRFSSWEALDGARMRYSYRSYGGHNLQEEFRGEAVLRPSGGGTATFSAPSERRIELPPQTVFPTAHIEGVLQQAFAGERFAILNHQVFDGAGFDALTQITSVIGRPRTTDDERDGGRAWPVSMAYYDLDSSSDMVPKFEASFFLRENGVLQDVVLDYGDFKLKGELESLDLLERPDC